MVVDREAKQKYAEEFGLLYSTMGMPPAYGNLLGWLMICDPPDQTSTELAEALQLSKGVELIGDEDAPEARRCALRGTFSPSSPSACRTSSKNSSGTTVCNGRRMWR